MVLQLSSLLAYEMLLVSWFVACATLPVAKFLLFMMGLYCICCGRSCVEFSVGLALFIVTTVVGVPTFSVVCMPALAIVVATHVVPICQRWRPWCCNRFGCPGSRLHRRSRRFSCVSRWFCRLFRTLLVVCVGMCDFVVVFAVPYIVVVFIGAVVVIWFSYLRFGRYYQFQSIVAVYWLTEVLARSVA